MSETKVKTCIVSGCRNLAEPDYCPDHIRARFDSWTHARLVDHAVSRYRSDDANQKHAAAIKRDLQRSEALRDVSLKELDAWLGAPLLRELTLNLWYLREAGEALSATVMENTMRVSRPDSSRDEGAPTRTYRDLKKSVRKRVQRIIKHIEDVTESIGNDLDRDEDLSEKRRFAALRSHHARGLHAGEPNDECSLCEGEEAS